MAYMLCRLLAKFCPIPQAESLSYFRSYLQTSTSVSNMLNFASYKLIPFKVEVLNFDQ